MLILNVLVKRTIIFLLVSCLSANTFAQNSFVDSLIGWINTHPKVDSQYIQTLHRISYRLSEKDVKKSFDYYERVSALSDSLNFTFGKALAQINLAILLSNSANYEASNNAGLQAITYAEACGALRLKAVALNNVADNFFTLKNLDRCRLYAKQAVEINTQLKAWRGVAINYELLSRCDFEEKFYAQAKEDLQLGMPFAIKANESYIHSQFYLGFGKLSIVEGRRDSAAIYFNQAMQQATLQGDLRNEFEVYMAKAEYLTPEKTGAKILWLNTALRIAQQTVYTNGIADAAQQLSTLYDELQNKDSSFFYYRIFRTASDSVFSANNRNMVIKESELLIKRQQSENLHLKQLAQLQYTEISFKNGLLVAFVISLLLVTGIAFFINRSIQNEKKREEAFLKQKISETQMQAMRAKLNPHFIFNSINSIENFIMQDNKRQASDYLNKFSKLIRTILDSSSEELVSFASDIETMQLYIDLELLRYNNKFAYQTHITPQLLTGDYRVPSLLLQPYLENAIMHGIAHSDKIGLHLILKASVESDFITYTIEDNGVGRKQAAEYNRQNKPYHKSVGLQLAEDRVNIFNGAIANLTAVEIIDLYDENNVPTGTKVIIKLKAI